MYLKSMEVQGFKSFANKTKLEFHDGITGIVGPNGSGKSNVADAVRWVLGEQSAKQLRGGNMQDVIFSGTEARKALGFASVAITLDNSDRQLNYDANEVTVMRKLFRSGESEYLLNGRNCRLKDINELFYDTGIGKEGYSIIGQGQIDQILNGRPEDRRELFDEAAGIVKFKRRKIASLKKLEQEQSNLVRVNDILTELTRQLDPLERQAQKAEKYLQMRDTLREMDSALFLLESQKTETDKKELLEKKTIAEQHLNDIDQALAKTKQEYERIEIQLRELDEKITETREDEQNSLIQKQQAEGRAEVLREQINAAENNTRLVRERISSIEQDRERRNAQYIEQQQEGERLAKQLDEALLSKNQAEKDTQELQALLSSKESEIEQKKSDTISLLNQRASIKENMQRYDTMLEQIGIRKAELSSRMLQARGDEEKEKAKLEQLETELKQAEAEAAQAQADIDETEKRISEISTLLREAGQRQDQMQGAYHRDASRLESLKNITERYEGYGNSIKKVMERKTDNSGIHGVVADLIEVPKKYEAAIETALGGALQNIVTDNEATAKYLIEYLKRGHFGRATFLPITAVRDEQKFTNSAVLKEQGVLGVAESLVGCSPVYHGIVNRLLGKTIVVDTIDHAIAVSRRYKQSVRMVTLEGELLSPGGSMTGGSFKYKSNLLGRRREIEELEKAVRETQREIDKLQAQVENQREERNELRDGLAQKNDALQQMLLKVNTLRLNRKVSLEKTGDLEQSYDKLSSERMEIDHQIDEIHDRRNDISGDLGNSEQEEQALANAIDALQAEVDELQKQEETLLKNQDEARMAFSNVQQQCHFVQERMRDIKEEMDRREEEASSLQNNLVSEADGVTEKEEQIKKCLADSKELQEVYEQCHAAIERYTEEKEQLNQNHKDFFVKRDELANDKNEMSQEVFRLEGRIEKLEESLDHLINYLFDEYSITPDQAEKYVHEPREDRQELKKEIGELKQEIRGLGNVNVNAIEEYKELKERHTFLSTQHEDLIKATETLQGIIQELDEGMRKQFREKFEQIRKEFDKVFRELFGGGKGTLELSDSDDVLESGILIISQPPGKKLQNMMQMSGGEKALTAIALLFAIQNLKPSPFCLLDEIEAALDDSNVTRYADYLHKLTRNTQFIIITHRRGTMNAADRLYGITMQEKGVSALVSVDLIENELSK